MICVKQTAVSALLLTMTLSATILNTATAGPPVLKNNTVPELIDQEYAKLNFTIPTGPDTSINILDTLVAGQVIEPNEKNLVPMSALFAVHGIPGLIETFTGTPYTYCKAQVFGFDGSYTKAICETRTLMLNICKTRENGCGIELVPDYVAAKGEILKNVPLLAFLSCNFAESEGGDVTKCFDSTYITDYFLPGVVQLIGLIEAVVPDGVNNRLFTMGIGQTNFGIEEGSISNYVVGDGVLSMNKESFGRQQMDIFTIFVSIWGITNAMAYAHTDVEEISYYYSDALLGYFSQKYHMRLFKVEGKENKTFQIRRKYVKAVAAETASCMFTVGYRAAKKCSYDAEGMLSFMDSYTALGLNNTCVEKGLTDEETIKVKKGKNTPLSYEDCKKAISG
jgi:hypothetical protein